MKKIISLLLVVAIILSFCSCNEKSLIDIKGAFYTDNGSIAIVFDYSDFENPLPENAEEITLTMNEVTYTVNENSKSSSHNTGVTSKFYDNFERYYGYSYALGYGEVSNDTPVRMMVVFEVEDMSNLQDASFTLGAHTISLGKDTFTEISSLCEIIRAEENFEEAYQIASFKWRIDAAYTDEEEIDIFKVPFGPDLSYVSEQMRLTFDSDVNWGVEITASPGTNYSYNEKLHEDVVNTNLPAFDIDIIKNAYPDATSQIDKFIEATNTLAESILDSSKSLDDFKVKGTRGTIKGTYAELCEIFDMSMVVAG
ncbi:MAG: hypothetical protein IJE10_06200 [Clostridia bacterium]|nr:hypothetical protein [Clostridia bacterium]